MEVTIVFSSGEQFCELVIPASSHGLELKRTLNARLSSQMTGYFQARPRPDRLPLAFKLRNSPREDPFQTWNERQWTLISLRTYSGEMVKDMQPAHEIPSLLCLLRPTDIVIESYDLQGSKGRVVLNTEEEVLWGQSSSGEELKVVVCSTKLGLFLCSACASETVQSLKTRLAAIIGKTEADIQLWQNCELLQESCTLQAYFLRNLSRISLQLHTDFLAVAIDSRGTSVLFPVTAHCRLQEIQQLILKLKRDWVFLSACSEFDCLFPTIPQIHRSFLLGQREDRILKLRFKHKSSLVAIPTQSMYIGQVKDYIESQHGLPAALIALHAVAEMKPWSSFDTYGIEEGDQFLLLRIPVKVEKLLILVKRKEKAVLKIKLPQCASIAELKRHIVSNDPTVGTELAISRGTEVLLDELTLDHYGIVTMSTLFCETLEEMQSKLCKSGSVPSDTYIESSDSLDLFDTEDLDRKLLAERYLKEQKSTFPVRIMTSTSLITLNVHTDCTVQVLKANLRSRIQAKSFKLYWKGKELEEQRTLLEQGVQSGALFLLLSPGCLRVTVLLPSGQTWPVVVQGQGTVHGVMRVLQQLTGLQEQAQRLILAKDLSRDEQLLPVGVETLIVSVKLGCGREYNLGTSSGVVLRVEASPFATTEEVQEQFTRRGVLGTLFFS